MNPADQEALKFLEHPLRPMLADPRFGSTPTHSLRTGGGTTLTIGPALLVLPVRPMLADRRRGARGPVPHCGAAGGTAFNVYQTEYEGQAGHTITQWHVNDIEAEVRDLKANGVTFEVYEGMPGVDWNGEIASIPNMGRPAWFEDSEGNIMCLDEGAPGS